MVCPGAQSMHNRGSGNSRAAKVAKAKEDTMTKKEGEEVTVEKSTVDAANEVVVEEISDAAADVAADAVVTTVEQEMTETEAPKVEVKAEEKAEEKAEPKEEVTPVPTGVNKGHFKWV